MVNRRVKEEEMGVYSIFHKETGELWVARSGKTSWKKPQHAKAAWIQYTGRNEVEHPSLVVTRQYRYNKEFYEDRAKFDEQDIYEIRQMVSYVDKSDLDKAKELLKEVYWNHQLDDILENQIKEFLGAKEEI